MVWLMKKGNRLTKVVTRTGDRGETSLVGGERVSKASLRVQAYGEVDELNSVVGLGIANLGDSELAVQLMEIQNQLFTVGADLASPHEVEVPRTTAKMVENIERMIERAEVGLKPLREFVLPGGSIGASWLHLARAVARRAERRFVALAEKEEVNSQIWVYLNRLSDLFFVLARVVNERVQVSEKLADFSKR